MLHDTVLDFLLIPFKIIQQFVLICIQVSADILFGLPIAEFRAHRDVILRPQDALLHVQLQLAAGQHVQPPGRVDAQHVHGKLLHG